MVKQASLRFPSRFLWGAATAAHQVEGNTNNQWTVWETEHAQVKAAQAGYQYGDLATWSQFEKDAKNPANYTSATLANHYDLYEQDFDLLDTMNMNAYRFSIEWSRIEPEEGVWNAEAIDHYKRYIAELKRREIEPIMTLFHFTLPTWFTDKGGFEKRSNSKYFKRFAEKAVSEIGRDVRYIITINEPEVYAHEGYILGSWPPAKQSYFRWWRVMNNLARAHRQAAKSIHSLGRRHKVSITKNSCYFYAGDDAWLSRLSARVMQFFQDDYLLRKVVKSCDFLGVNYYQSFRVYGYRIHNPEKVDKNDLGWDLQPADIEFALERVYRKYKLPIIVTENGLADAADTRRQWWITQTLLAMQRAMEEGVVLEGYLHWSLLDNFEWDKGRWPRFGLAAVDYSTGERTLRPSALWFAKIIRQLRGK